MKTTNKNFPKVFETRTVELKAIELGIHTQHVSRDEAEEKAYFNAFELEVIEGTFNGVSAKLEIAKYNGEILAGWAFLGNGRDMQVPAANVIATANQITK